VCVCVWSPSQASEVELYIEGTEFKFFCQPYFLSLSFDHPVKETMTASAKYDISTGVLTIVLPKATPGQHFDNLEMITKLLTPSRNRLPTPLEKSKPGNFQGKSAACSLPSASCRLK
ncbi:MAG: hypothetical protein AAF386_02630, partial [Pseudomonadota bacterium]